MDNALKVHKTFLEKQAQQLQKFSERRDALIAQMDAIDQAVRDLAQEQNAASNALQADFDTAFAEARAKDEAELAASRADPPAARVAAAAKTTAKKVAAK